jgi:HEAT repeat protein
MTRSLLLCACLAALSLPSRAQIDLPSRPVRSTAPAHKAPVHLPEPKRGDLARRAKGEPVEPGAASAAPELPKDAPKPEPPPLADALPPGQPLASAAHFILEQVARARSLEDSVVLQAAPSLANLGPEALVAVREALSSDHEPTLVVAARVLLGSGDAFDDELVVRRLKSRVPNGACAPLLDALSEVDPVRAEPALYAELLSHPQGAMRAAAQRRLAVLPPAVLVDVLGVPLQSKLSDARLRALQLLSTASEPRAVELIFTCLADPSPEVARRAADALAVSASEDVPRELLRRAFDGRWILRANAYALLALVDREDLRLEPVLAAEHVDALLGGISASDAFVSGTCAAALAGVGFRTEDTAATPWLDKQVPERLVVALSGREFHADFSALQSAALRRLTLITGESFGTDGARWVSWWVATEKTFSARRASLPYAAEDAATLRIDLLTSVPGESSLCLLGPAPEAGSGATAVPRTQFLSASQASQLCEVLQAEGLFSASRLPGSRGSGKRGSRTLEIALGGRSKVFTFSAEASEPWFARAVSSVQALAERNRWQLYPVPGIEVDARAAFEHDGAWWDSDASELERDQRLKERVLGALPIVPVSGRDEGLRELERLAAAEGRLEPEDFDALLSLLADERFSGARSHLLVGLALRSVRAAPDGPVPSEAGTRLVDLLDKNLGPLAGQDLTQVLESMGPEAVRAAAHSERPLQRAVAASLLARDASDEDFQLLLGLLADKDPEVEIAAVRAIGVQKVDAGRTEVLVRARVAEPALRAVALEAAGQLGGENALDVLVVGLSDPDLQVAAGAARGLAALADPSTATLLVAVLGRAQDDPLVAPARRGLLAMKQGAWPELQRAMRAPGSHARREAALLLSMQSVADAAPALMRVLAENPKDARVALELAILTGVDLRAEPDPAAAWLTWWTGVVHDDPLAWFLAALERAGVPTPEAAVFSGSGTSEGAAFLAGILSRVEPSLAERARRELARLLGREIEPLPPPGPEFDRVVEALQQEIGSRAW